MSEQPVVTSSQWISQVPSQRADSAGDPVIPVIAHVAPSSHVSRTPSPIVWHMLPVSQWTSQLEVHVYSQLQSGGQVQVAPSQETGMLGQIGPVSGGPVSGGPVSGGPASTGGGPESGSSTARQPTSGSHH